MTQQEANRLFEDPDIKIYELYSNVVRIVLFCSFYFSISPGVGLVGLLALVATYWVDKYNILRRSFMPTNLRSEIAEAMFEYLDVSIFLLALGNFFFFKYSEAHSGLEGRTLSLAKTFSIFGLVIAIIYVLLPNKRIARACCSKKRTAQDCFTQPLLHQQSREFFTQDYFTANPVIKDITVTKEFKDIYTDVAAYFECIDVVKEFPELLPIFKYAIKRPHISEVLRKNLEGLANPYFIFPQNFAYGTSKTHLESVISQYSPPRYYSQETENRNRVVSNKDTDINDSEIRDRVDMFEVDHMGATLKDKNSIMGELSLLKHLKSDTSDSEDKSGKSFGANLFSHNGSYMPANSYGFGKDFGHSMQGVSLMNGISPIGKGGMPEEADGEIGFTVEEEDDK